MRKSIDVDHLISDLVEYFHDHSRKKIFNNLCNELLNTGWNVCKAVDEYGVTPHVFNDKMIALYTHSEAFIYELIVGGLELDKINKDNFIINYLKQYYK